jgi:hypothetical protein
MAVVLSGPDYNYHKAGSLTMFAGENVVGKEEWAEEIMVALEGALAAEWGYVRPFEFSAPSSVMGRRGCG